MKRWGKNGSEAELTNSQSKCGIHASCVQVVGKAVVKEQDCIHSQAISRFTHLLDGVIIFSDVWPLLPSPTKGGRRLYFLVSPRLFVFCLCVGYLKTLWKDSNEIWWGGWVCDKDELIRCWWRSGSDYWNFKSDSSPLRDGTKNDI